VFSKDIFKKIDDVLELQEQDIRAFGNNGAGAKLAKINKKNYIKI
jgi:hypothetical protein